MVIIVLVALFIGTLFREVSPTAYLICMYFIGAQAMLAYFSSGAAKVVSPAWRSGKAFQNIMNSYSYGNHFVSRMVTRFPGLSLIASWIIILFQLSFPIVILLPYPWNYCYLAMGLAFHLAIAITMSLNLFVPAFVSTYPALLVIQNDVAKIVGV